MSDTAVDIPFAGGVYRFWLPVSKIIELERICGQRDSSGLLHAKSVTTIFDQIAACLGMAEEGEPKWLGGGSPMIRDVHAVIRLGLMGGGQGSVGGEDVSVSDVRAGEMIESYCYPNVPFEQDCIIAGRVLHAVHHGINLKKNSATELAESLNR